MKDGVALNQHAPTAHLEFEGASPPPTLRLSREEVQRIYAPPVDSKWTPEREAAFFASLPKLRAPAQSKERELLVREYAKDTLGAQRVSHGYLEALGTVLGAFAEADRAAVEVRLSQRMTKYGTPQTLRTIQTQMETAGVLTREVRSQGFGFVGQVYVYKPFRSPWLCTEDLEEMRERRAAPYPNESLTGLGIEDVPF